MNSILRVHICGAQSTGKTTLLKYVKSKIPEIHGESEVARKIIEKNFQSRDEYDPAMNPKTFIELQRMILMQQAEVDRQNVALKQDYIADRGIDPIVYAWIYGGEGAKRTLTSLQVVQEMIQRYRDSLIFVIFPHQECLVDDDVRIALDMKELWRFTDSLVLLLDELEIKYIPVKVLDLAERGNIVISEILKQKSF